MRVFSRGGLALVAAAVLGLVVPTSATAVTKQMFNAYTNGAHVYGWHWRDGSRTYIELWIDDTKADGGRAYSLVHFTRDCCATKLENNNGAHTTRYFKLSSGTAGTNIRVTAGAQNFPWWDHQSNWVNLYPR